MLAPKSTPHPKPFPRCDYCEAPGSFSMRDAVGIQSHACGDHTRRMEDDVRAANGWDRGVSDHVEADVRAGSK